MGDSPAPIIDAERAASIARLRENRDRLTAQIAAIDAELAASSVNLLLEQRAALNTEITRVNRALKALGAPISDRRLRGSKGGPTDLIRQFAPPGHRGDFTAQDVAASPFAAGWRTRAQDPVLAINHALNRLAETGEYERTGVKGWYRRSAS